MLQMQKGKLLMSVSDTSIKRRQEFGVAQNLIEDVPFEYAKAAIESNPLVANLIMIFRWLLSIVSLSSELFLRHTFGLRYLMINSVVTTLLVMGISLAREEIAFQFSYAQHRNPTFAIFLASSCPLFFHTQLRRKKNSHLKEPKSKK